MNDKPSTIRETREPVARLPVVAWWGIPHEETTLARYRELAEAGFTHNLSYLPDPDAAAKALDVAQQAGVKQLVYFGFEAGFSEFLNDPASVAARFKGHPALAGYRLWDEPSVADFPKLAGIVERLRAADPNALGYINLLPNYAEAAQLGCARYADYADRFLAEVPVEVVSFDHYPFSNPTVETIWFENLEMIADRARRIGKPFWGFVESHEAAGRNPRVPSLADMRLQAFANLTYGAQAIQYFTYWTPDEPGYLSAPIGKDGRRTPIYDAAKTVNAEIAALSGVFLGSEALDVRHTGRTIPAATRHYAPAHPVTALQTQGHGAVVSLLKRNDRRFLAIVNRDPRHAMGLELEWDAAVPVARVDKTGALHPTPAGSLQTTVEPGDITVFAWSDHV